MPAATPLRCYLLPLKVLCFLLCIYQNLFATHIVGGELTYQCTGNNNYLVTLKVYRDCFNGQAPFDNPAIVGVYDQSQNLVTVLNMNFPGSNPVPPAVVSPCLVPPANVCVEEAVYQETINLPPIPGGYTLVYQRCCRNGTISNLNNPGGTGSTYSAYIPGPNVVSCNSSPIFNNFPPLFLCAGVPVNFDHSATDPDGDSLVYTMCDPFNGGSTSNPAPNPPSPPPFSLVSFSPPYSASNPLGGAAPLTVNPSTGQLSGTPATIGQYVVGVCVSEYRNGVLISTTLRDFQFNIVSCNITIASIPSQTVFCDGLTVDFFGNSVNGTNYFWNFGDPASTADTSHLQNTSYTYSDTGVYTVMLVAYDPTANCIDTTYSVFQVYPQLDPSFIPPQKQCFNNNSFSFTAGGAFTSDATFQWNFGPNAIPGTSTQQNPAGIEFLNGGTHLITLSISQYGCTESYTDTIEIIPNPIAAIGDLNRFCVGNSVTFANTSQNSTLWHWDFGVAGISSDTSNQFSPTYLYPDSSIYTVTLIASNQGLCSDTITETFLVFPLLAPILQGAEDQCLADNAFLFTAAGAYTSDAILAWDFGAQAQPQLAASDTVFPVVYNQLGTYPVSLTVAQYGCSVTLTDSVGLFRSPEAGFMLNDRAGCPPFQISLADTSISDTPPMYFWDFGDNASSTLQNPDYSYFFPGTYDITLTIITTTGCIDTSVVTLTDAVMVIPMPVPGLVIPVKKVSVFEPVVQVNDTSRLRIGCRIYISDGSWYDTCTVTHNFRDTGVYYISQVVVNEFGCRDSVTLEVYVYPEFRLFIPNAFTPNRDELNDIFLPVILGSEQYLLEIYNRWGERIFVTDKQNLGWDGKQNGADCAQDAYVYRITVRPPYQQQRILTGSVTLIR